jgi:hypothetical protein
MLATVMLKGTRSIIGGPVSWSIISAWTNNTVNNCPFILDSNQEAASGGSTNPLFCAAPGYYGVCYDAETAAPVWHQFLNPGAPYAELAFVDTWYDPSCQ